MFEFAISTEANRLTTEIQRQESPWVYLDQRCYRLIVQMLRYIVIWEDRILVLATWLIASLDSA